MSQEDDPSSVSEVDAFCSNEECRDPIVVMEYDGYTCKSCEEIFCQICIEYIAKDLGLEYFLEDEDGFCSECAVARRMELSPDTEEGRQAVEINAVIKNTNQLRRKRK